MNTPIERRAHAAIATLIILQVVMLLSLYSRTFPHPPETVAPFAIAPFLAVSLSFATGALLLGPLDDRLGQLLSVLAALCALVSYGPQKYLDAQFGVIWPAVIIGQVAVAGVIAAVWVTRSRASQKALA